MNLLNFFNIVINAFYRLTYLTILRRSFRVLRRYIKKRFRGEPLFLYIFKGIIFCRNTETELRNIKNEINGFKMVSHQLKKEFLRY